MLLVAFERGHGVHERNLSRHQVCFALLALGERLSDGCARVRIVEAGDDLVTLHALPFLDQHVDHFAGDLRGDGRLSARHDVAGSVEYRPGTHGNVRWSGFRSDDADRYARLRPPDQHSCDTDRDEQDAGAYPPSPRAAGARIAIVMIDTKLTEQR